MKAALNGVPSLSILDGWWAEGHIEGVTGWSIGEPRRSMDPENNTTDNSKEAESLYWKLENIILPMFYKEPRQYIQIMQHAIAIKDRSSIRSGWCRKRTLLRDESGLPKYLFGRNGNKIHRVIIFPPVGNLFRRAYQDISLCE
jgi:hypothetical protein